MFNIEPFLSFKLSTVAPKKVLHILQHHCATVSSNVENKHTKINFQLGQETNKIYYTTLTNFSTKYLIMCKVYTDVGVPCLSTCTCT